MYKKFVLFVGLLVVLATNSPAQNPPTQNISGPNDTVRLSSLERGLAEYLAREDDDEPVDVFTRPRIVPIKAASVKASVVFNTVAAERTAFQMINQMRAERGLSQLVWSDEIAAIARLHSQNMADFNFFSHRGLDNKMVSDRADDVGARKWRAIGENIAYHRGYQDPVRKAIELWFDSPSHRRNMLDDKWKEAAVGIAVTPEGAYYFTQVFWVKK